MLQRTRIAEWTLVVAAALVLLSLQAVVAVSAEEAGNPPASPSPLPPSISLRLPGRKFEDLGDSFDDCCEDLLFEADDSGVVVSQQKQMQKQKRRGSWKMTGLLGREFDLFDTRGGQDSEETTASSTSTTSNHLDHHQDESDDDEPSLLAPWAMNAHSSRQQHNQHQHQQQQARPSSLKTMFPSSSSSSSSSSDRTTSSASKHQQQRGGSSTSTSSSTARPTVITSVQEWWTSNINPTIKTWPRIQCRVEPTTTLKIRKTFRPLKTIVRLGADFNTQLGVWQFKSSWEDALIGGKITLAGKELQISKSWQLSVGAVEDLVTRLRFRAAVDLVTWKAYARVGFRTERLSPINIMEGFTLLKQLPLDGTRGNVKLEVKANFALPEPEIEYSTESHRSLVGMGDIEVNIDELNLVLDY